MRALTGVSTCIANSCGKESYAQKANTQSWPQMRSEYPPASSRSISSRSQYNIYKNSFPLLTLLICIHILISIFLKNAANLCSLVL